jgi:hypothetical protein
MGQQLTLFAAVIAPIVLPKKRAHVGNQVARVDALKERFGRGIMYLITAVPALWPLLTVATVSIREKSPLTFPVLTTCVEDTLVVNQQALVR